MVLVVFTLFIYAVFRNFPRKAYVDMTSDHNYHDALRENLNKGKGLANLRLLVLAFTVHLFKLFQEISITEKQAS